MNNSHRFIKTLRSSYYRKKDYYHIDKENYLFAKTNYYRDLLAINYYRNSFVEANYY